MRPPARRAEPLLGLAATVVLVPTLVACLPGGTRGSGSLSPAGGAGASEAVAATATPPSGPTPSPSFVPPTPTPAPTFLVYTVRRGDSLNSIAHTYGTTARSIAFWNRTTYPSLDPESASYKPGLLQVGWTLALLPNLVVDEDSGEAVYPSEEIPAP